MKRIQAQTHHHEHETEPVAIEPVHEEETELLEHAEEVLAHIAEVLGETAVEAA